MKGITVKHNRINFTSLWSFSERNWKKVQTDRAISLHKENSKSYRTPKNMSISYLWRDSKTYFKNTMKIYLNKLIYRWRKSVLMCCSAHFFCQYHNTAAWKRKVVDLRDVVTKTAKRLEKISTQHNCTHVAALGLDKLTLTFPTLASMLTLAISSKPLWPCSTILFNVSSKDSQINNLNSRKLEIYTEWVIN